MDMPVEERRGNMTISRRINWRRRQLQMSQEDLASRVGVSQGTISLYEKGEVDIPSKRVRELARELRTSVAYLYGETDSTDARDALRSEGVPEDVLRGLSEEELLMLEAAGRRLAGDLLRKQRPQ